MSVEKKIFQIDKKEICITSSQIKQAIDLLVNENEILRDKVYKLEEELQQKENIIKEVRERAERELKIAEENIKNSEQWLEVEEEQEHAKKDIHTGKVIKRCMKMFLEILDNKGE